MRINTRNVPNYHAIIRAAKNKQLSLSMWSTNTIKEHFRQAIDKRVDSTRGTQVVGTYALKIWLQQMGT